MFSSQTRAWRVLHCACATENTLRCLCGLNVQLITVIILQLQAVTLPLPAPETAIFGALQISIADIGTTVPTVQRSLNLLAI